MTAPEFSEPRRGSELDWRRRFVEDMGGLVLVHGTPRAMMRVLGWMVVCDPPEQTAGDIQEELSLSAGSVSTSVRMLGDVGLLERAVRPGDRRTYYRLCDDGWEKVLEGRFRAFNEMRCVADRALDAAVGEADDRLVVMRDTWAFMEVRSEALLRDSRERRAAAKAAVALDEVSTAGA
jgi:DNA-binding MarR family transcriptional regulator